uniref:MICOS complex subunit MIC60 n=1 Tax=Plectus sambesii TaxID=2011161 RepID=A0A914VVZ9_9BILA
MLRAAQRGSSLGRRQLQRQQAVRFQSAEAAHSGPSSSGGGSGLGKLLVYTAGAAVAGAAGIVGYAYVDPTFRQNMEISVPQTKAVFDTVIGKQGIKPIDSSKTTPSPGAVSDLKNKVLGLLPGKKEDEHTKDGRSAGEAAASTPLLKPKPKVEDKSSSTPAPAPTKKEVVNLGKAIVDEEAAKTKANSDLEERIKYAITSVEKKLSRVFESKNKTIVAINHHAKLLREAVEDPQDPKWAEVNTALDHMQYAADLDSNDEVDTRNYLDNLRKIVNDGRSSNMTATNPILVNANESLNKLQYQLDELNAKVNQARMESRIMTEYRQLIEESRRQFANELKSILPNIDLHASDSKLSEDELNALIAHAHLRVDQLRKQFTEQQLREEQHIAEAIERQKAEDKRVAEERLNMELSRVQGETDTLVERKVTEKQGEWEGELRAQLRRAAAAHSEHLEEVVRAQKELLELEHARQREDAIQKERDVFHREVSGALARLEGIEAALDSRAAQDAENRKAKELWLACQNLVESVVHGRKGGTNVDTRKKPLAGELMAIKEASASDPFVNTVLKSLADESLYEGVYTQEDLKARFLKVYKLGWRTARIGDNGGTLFQYLWSTVMSFLMFDVQKNYSLEEKFNPDALDTFAILSRAKHFLIERDDITSAVRLLQLLEGEPARVARSWVHDARVHLETRQAAELLLAHAAAISMRTVY